MDVVFLAVLALTVTSGALAQQKVDQRRAAAADAVVSINTLSGSVAVTGWDRAEVWVTGTVGEGVELSPGPERIDVKVKSRAGARHGDAVLEVKVPKGGKVEVETISADVSVSGVTGDVRAQSVSGAVKVVGPTAGVAAKSVSGTVAIDGAASRARATNVSGTITVRGGPFEECDIQTVSGAAHFDGALAPKGSLDVKTVSGPIDVIVPSSVGAEFALDTFSGAIDFSGDLRAVVDKSHGESHGFGPGKNVTFTTGNGGAHVSGKTFSGPIKLATR
jgi:hypothetical protein